MATFKKTHSKSPERKRACAPASEAILCLVRTDAAATSAVDAKYGEELHSAPVQAISEWFGLKPMQVTQEKQAQEFERLNRELDLVLIP